MKIAFRFVQGNGLRIHVAEVGTGPTVLLLHGFPECWVSWRHQMLALAKAGYRAVAPDMRGYGLTDAPASVHDYTIHHLAGDAIAMLDAIDAERAVVVGHDWGAPVAWHCGLFRPDRVRGVFGLSVPFRPRQGEKPTTTMARTVDAQFYQLYFQEEGVAESEFERDIETTVRTFAWMWSAQSDDLSANGMLMVPRNAGMLSARRMPAGLPPWMSEEEFAIYVAALSHSGFRGPLNWYRNMDRNWELSAAWSGSRLQVPAAYMVGDKDLLMHFPFMRALLPELPKLIPQLKECSVVPGCGHRIQRERHDLVNARLLEFLEALP